MLLTDIKVIWNVTIGAMIKVEWRALCCKSKIKVSSKLSVVVVYVCYTYKIIFNKYNEKWQKTQIPSGQLRLEIKCLWAFMDFCMLKSQNISPKWVAVLSIRSSVYLLSCFFSECPMKLIPHITETSNKHTNQLTWNNLDFRRIRLSEPSTLFHTHMYTNTNSIQWQKEPMIFIMIITSTTACNICNPSLLYYSCGDSYCHSTCHMCACLFLHSISFRYVHILINSEGSGIATDA